MLSLIPLGLLFNGLSIGINLWVFLDRFFRFRCYHKTTALSGKEDLQTNSGEY